MSRSVSVIFSRAEPCLTIMFIACNSGIKVVSWLLSQFIANSMAKNYSDGYWFSLETENWKCIIKKSRVLSSCLFPIRAKSKFVCVSGKPRQVKTAELQMSRWWWLCWLFLCHEIIPSVNTSTVNSSTSSLRGCWAGRRHDINKHTSHIYCSPAGLYTCSSSK